MKNSSEKSKLYSQVLYAIEAKSRSTSTEEITHDSPMVVRFRINKNGLMICDSSYNIKCKFTKRAIFWFKMSYNNMNISAINGRYIFLSEYSLQYSINEKRKVEIYLVIYSFSLLTLEEAQEYGYMFEKTNDITKNNKIESYMKNLPRLRPRLPLDKRIDELPNLEAILTSGKGKRQRSIKRSPSKPGLYDESGEQVVNFADMPKLEKEMSKDVQIMLDQDAKCKGKVKEGSEGNLERDLHLSEIVDKLKDKELTKFLKEHGTLFVPRDPAKSPVKRGRMPVDFINVLEDVKMSRTGKRKKAEERSSSKKPKKKAAFDEKGKRAVSVKGKKHAKPMKQKSGKKLK